MESFWMKWRQCMGVVALVWSIRPSLNIHRWCWPTIATKLCWSPSLLSCNDSCAPLSHWSCRLGAWWTIQSNYLILQNYYYCSSSWIAIILMNDDRNSFYTFNVWIPQNMTNFTLACCSLGASTLSTLSSILSLFYLSWLCILWEFYYSYDSMNTRMQKWHQIALD